MSLAHTALVSLLAKQLVEMLAVRDALAHSKTYTLAHSNS